MNRNPTEIFWKRQIEAAKSQKKSYLINKQVEEMETQARQVLLTQQYSPVGTLARKLNNTRYEDFSDVDNVIESETSEMRFAKKIDPAYDEFSQIVEKLIEAENEAEKEEEDVQIIKVKPAKKKKVNKPMPADEDEETVDESRDDQKTPQRNEEKKPKDTKELIDEIIKNTKGLFEQASNYADELILDKIEKATPLLKKSEKTKLTKRERAFINNLRRSLPDDNEKVTGLQELINKALERPKTNKVSTPKANKTNKVSTPKILDPFSSIASSTPKANIGKKRKGK